MSYEKSQIFIIVLSFCLHKKAGFFYHKHLAMPEAVTAFVVERGYIFCVNAFNRILNVVYLK